MSPLRSHRLLQHWTTKRRFRATLPYVICPQGRAWLPDYWSRSPDTLGLGIFRTPAPHIPVGVHPTVSTQS